MNARLGHNTRERLGSAVLLGVGILLVSQGLSLPLGNPASFGPGLFPVIIGGLMMLAAALLLVFPEPSDAEDGDVAPLAWRSMLFVAAGMTAFALIIRTWGLVPATMATVLLTSCGDQAVRPLQAIALSIAMALLGTAIFIWGLNLPLAAIRW